MSAPARAAHGVRKCVFCGGLMQRLTKVPDWLNARRLIEENHPLPFVGRMMGNKADAFAKDLIENRVEVWECGACGWFAMFNLKAR